MKDRLAPLLIGVVAFLAGAAGAWFYSAGDLAISHFDARAHLVVARRILDSLTPGWQQIGAVWLPLPHLLNMVPVQIDAWYRSGASAIAISIASTGVAAWALVTIHPDRDWFRRGRCWPARHSCSPIRIWLYLQSTPMTEPLLLATALLSLTLVADWIERGAEGWPQAASLALTATCMTRYEGWVIAAATAGLAAAVLVRRGTPVSGAIRSASSRWSRIRRSRSRIFSANSRWTIGTWFIPRDFFVPENDALGNAGLAWEQVRTLGAPLVRHRDDLGRLCLGAALTVLAFVRSRQRASLALLLALFACVTHCPGTPTFRDIRSRRYGLLLVAACAALAGAGIGLLWRPLRLAAAVASSPSPSRRHPHSAGMPCSSPSRKGMRRTPPGGRRDELPASALRSQRRRRAHHDEHGLARALHARPRTRRIRRSQLPARGQRSRHGNTPCSVPRVMCTGS